MCGRFALDHTTNDLIEEFVVSENRFPDWAPHWNIAPTSTIPIIAERSQGVREVGPAHWSLVPPWSTELKLAYPTFNARSETAATKPTFRHAVAHTRCIIPASGYYEWAMVEGKKKPHFIHHPSHPVVALAGLYSWWKGPKSSTPIATTTILTMDSVGQLRSIHDRMPVFLEREFFSHWLNPEDLGGDGLITRATESSAAYATQLEFQAVSALGREGFS